MKPRTSLLGATLPERKALIRARLKAARILAGFSQAQAACVLGIHRPTLSLIERGGQTLTVDLILDMANAYGFTPEYLMACSADQTNAGMDPCEGNLKVLGANAFKPDVPRPKRYPKTTL